MEKLIIVLCVLPTFLNGIQIADDKVEISTAGPSYSVLEKSGFAEDLENSTARSISGMTKVTALPLERPLKSENIEKSLKVL